VAGGAVVGPVRPADAGVGVPVVPRVEKNLRGLALTTIYTLRKHYWSKLTKLAICFLMAVSALHIELIPAV
jgi:hypothetical protein